jgi:hypothetical protein
MIHFDDIQMVEGYSPFRATLQAGFAKVVFTFELARRLIDTGVTANTFNPGLVKSRLPRQLPRFAQPFVSLFEFFLSEQCKTGVYLAVSPAVANTTGRFFSECRVVTFQSKHYDESVRLRLWQISEALTGLR